MSCGLAVYRYLAQATTALNVAVLVIDGTYCCGVVPGHVVRPAVTDSSLVEVYGYMQVHVFINIPLRVRA